MLDDNVMDETTVGSPQRRRFATANPDEARDFMDRTYGARRLLVRARRDTDWRLSVDQVAAPGIVSGDMRLPAELGFDIEGQDAFVINTLRSGKVEYEYRDGERFKPGDVYIGNHPQMNCACRTDQVRAHTLNLPATLLAETAGYTLEDPPPVWEPSHLLAVSGGGNAWRKVVRFVDELLADPAAGPLEIGPAVRLLAGTALTVFVGLTVAGETTADRHDGHTNTLRRAIAFIETNAHVDVSVADIARAAGVTPRAVQLAFRRHLDTTPTAHLQQLRLDAAHRELLAADPTTGESVAAVARRWGFVKPATFVVQYTKYYGCRPDATLQS